MKLKDSKMSCKYMDLRAVMRILSRVIRLKRKLQMEINKIKV